MPKQAFADIVAQESNNIEIRTKALNALGTTFGA